MSGLQHEHAKFFNRIPLSVLDLAPIRQGANAGESLKESVELAQHIERLGFKRYWLEIVAELFD